MLLSSFFFINVVGSDSAFNSNVYTPSSETHCVDGICNLILYSGNMFYDNGTGYKAINSGLISYGQDGYDYVTNYTPYKMYAKANSNWGDGIKYCIGNNCLIYQSSDMSYRDSVGSQDYLSNILGVTGVVDGSSITYSDVFSNSNVDLAYITQNELIKEEYIISDMPRSPAGYLGDNITFDFGGYIKYGDLSLFNEGQNKTGVDFVTSEEIDFVNSTGQTIFYLPKPYAYDSNESKISIQYEVHNQGGQIWFYVRTPYSWLDDASRVYPIIVDPTTVMLQDADTENLEDDWWVLGGAHGSATTLQTGQNFDGPATAAIKFTLPQDLDIVDADLSIYVTTQGYDAGDTPYMTIYGVSDQTWVEGGSKPATSTFIGNFPDGDAGTTGWHDYNVSTWVISEEAVPHTNVSFHFNSTLTGTLNDAFNFASKEYATTSLRPYLNISYNEPDPTTVPPVTTLSLPEDTYTGVVPENVQFQCNATDNLNLQNVTWYLWNSTDDIINSSSSDWSGTSNSTDFYNNFNIPDTYHWNCLVYDNNSNSDWGDSNYTLTMTEYSLDITTPTTGSPASVSDGDNITINFNYTYPNSSTYITSGVTLENITIGGQECSIVQKEGVGGTTLVDFETFDTGTDNQPVNTNWTTYYSVDSGCVWWKDSDGTTSTSTGPCAGASNCATNDAGYDDNTYAFVETSSSNCNTGNAHAYLAHNDTDMDTYSNINFTFAYNMYGADMGNLSVQVDDGVGGWDILWYLDGDQGTAWHVVSLDLSGYSGTRDIRFDYDRNGHTGYWGDVAVDVLNISNINSGLVDSYEYIPGVGWQVNVTVPSGFSGTQNLYMNATYNGVTRNDTQTNAIDYGGGGATVYNRSGTVSISTNNFLGNLFQGQRDLSGGIGITSSLIRIGELVRNVFSSLTFNNIVLSFQSLIRRATQLLTFQFISSKMNGVSRNMDQALTFMLVLFKVGQFLRAPNQQISENDAVLGQSLLLRQASQSVTFGSFVIVTSGRIRGLSQAIAFNDFLDRNFYGVRQSTDSLGFDTAMNILSSLRRGLTGGITINDILLRIFGGNRGSSQSITVSQVNTQQYSLFRGDIISVTISNSVSRLSEFIRNPFQIITFTTQSITSNLQILLENLFQSIGINLTQNELSTFMRNFVDSLNVNNILDKIFGGNRNLNQNIDVGNLNEEQSSLFRINTISITISNSVSRLSEFIRNPLQIITFTTQSITSHLQILLKSLFQSFGMNLTQNELSSFIRNFMDSLNVNNILDKIFGGNRNLNQNIDVGNLNEEQSSLFRINTISITISNSVSRLSEFIRNPFQGVTFVTQTISNHLQILLKNLFQSIGINLTQNELSIFVRNFIDNINVNNILNKVLGANKFVQGGININNFLNTLSELSRGQNQQINVNSELTRIFNGERDINQGIDFTFTIERINNFFRLQSISITFSDSMNRFLDIIRGLSQIFSFVFNLFSQSVEQYSLAITFPTTSNIKVVATEDILTVYFNFTNYLTSINQNITVTNISIAGQECPILQNSLNLSSPNTENLDDVGTYNLVGDPIPKYENAYMFIKFNISSLPQGVNIKSASLTLYNESPMYDDPDVYGDIRIEGIENQTWAEESSIDALKGLESSFVNQTNYYNLTWYSGSETLNVTNTTIFQFSNLNYNNVSFVLYKHDLEGSINECNLSLDTNTNGASSPINIGQHYDRLQVVSKEGSPTLYPKLSITYSNPETTNTQQLKYNDTTLQWEVNCTVPSNIGLQDLFVEANYTTQNVLRNSTQSNSISYGIAYLNRFLIFPLSFTDNIERIYNGFRFDAISFTIGSSINKLPHSIRNLFQSLSFSNISTRIVNLFKSIYQNITLTFSQIRNMLFGRGVSDSFTINGIVSKVNSFFKSLLDSFGLNDFINRLFIGTRDTTQSITISQFGVEQILFSRGINQDISFSLVVNRFGEFFRNPSQIILFNLNIINENFQDIFKFLSQVIGINLSENQITGFSRRISNVFNFNLIVDRIGNSYRNLNHLFNINSILLRIGELFKINQQGINVNDQVTIQRGTSRYLVDSISFGDVSENFRNSVRILTQSFTINGISDELQNIFKNLEQIMNINSSILRSRYFLINLNQAISFVTNIFSHFVDVIIQIITNGGSGLPSSPGTNINLNNVTLDTKLPWCSNTEEPIEIFTYNSEQQFVNVSSIEVSKLPKNISYGVPRQLFDRYVVSFFPTNSTPNNFSISFTIHQNSYYVEKSIDINKKECTKLIPPLLLIELDSFWNAYWTYIILVLLLIIIGSLLIIILKIKKRRRLK